MRLWSIYFPITQSPIESSYVGDFATLSCDMLGLKMRFSFVGATMIGKDSLTQKYELIYTLVSYELFLYFGIIE